jgi:hypothetical protein
MASLTPNYNLILPSVNDPTDQDLWGGMLNSNFSAIDTLFVESIKTVTSDVTTSGNVTEADSNKMILVDATAGNVTLLLLAAATAGDGFKFAVKKIDASANTVTLDPNASETIDGEATYVLSQENSSVLLVSDGTNWQIMADSVVVSPASETVAGVIEIATIAEIEAGTDNTRAITPAGLKGAGGFTNYFESAEETFTTGSLVSVAHGLGGRPKLVVVELVAKVANGNFDVDDRLTFTTFYSSDGRGLTVYSDETNAYFRYGTNIIIVGASPTIINPANWRVILKAWA